VESTEKLFAALGYSGLFDGGRMNKKALCLVLCSLSAVAIHAGAAGLMKPGLWEMTMKSDAFRNMPKLSPEQIEQMRKMGVEMPQMTEGGMQTKVCISRAMAERDEPPMMDGKDTGCEAKNYKRSGNAYSVDVICNGKDMKGTGTARGTYLNSQSFTSTYDFKGTVHGQPVNQRHESSGKWLAADCGNIRPMEDMLKK
jgi:hypothetical protein